VPSNFEPFRVVPYLGGLRNWPSTIWLLLLPLVVVLVVVGSLLQGTVGGLTDFQPLWDVQRALGVGNPPPSRPNFPLTRDVIDGFLIVVICVTIPLIHRQWILMSRVIEGLLSSGALTSKAAPSLDRVRRLLRVEKVLTSVTHGTPLERLIGAANRWLDKVGRSSGILVAVSFALALLIAIGPNRNGLFRAFSGDLPAETAETWLREAYDSWWAAISHPGGFFLYVLLMALGIYLVLIQNTVGLTAVYCLIALSAVADFDLDWLDRDGNFGWQPVTEVFRTVVLSLVLHGSALSLTLLALGVDNFPWVFGVVLIWIVMLPSVTLGPLYALRGLSRAAQEKRVDQLVTFFNTTPSAADPLQQVDLRGKIVSVRAAKARPLRLRRAELPAFFVLVLLPIFLTTVQVYFSVTYGGGK